MVFLSDVEPYWCVCVCVCVCVCACVCQNASSAYGEKGRKGYESQGNDLSRLYYHNSLGTPLLSRRVGTQAIRLSLLIASTSVPVDLEVQWGGGGVLGCVSGLMLGSRRRAKERGTREEFSLFSADKAVAIGTGREKGRWDGKVSSKIQSLCINPFPGQKSPCLLFIFAIRFSLNAILDK